MERRRLPDTYELQYCTAAHHYRSTSSKGSKLDARDGCVTPLLERRHVDASVDCDEGGIEYIPGRGEVSAL